MVYTQGEVNILIQESNNELLKKLEDISREQRRTLHKKGKLLNYGLHLHLIPKGRFNKLKKTETPTKKHTK